MAKKDKVDLSKNFKKSEENTPAEENIDVINKEGCENNSNTETDVDDNSANEVVEETIQKAEFDALNNKMLRLQADFFNFRNRTEKERASTYGNAVSDVLTDLLPIIDNFERAIESDNSENQEVINFKNGVKMIYDQLYSSLQKKGLKEIAALNSKFDPNMHSGIAFEVIKEKEEDTVIEVFQKGYTVNDKVIRPSMVKIAKK